ASVRIAATAASASTVTGPSGPGAVTLARPSVNARLTERIWPAGASSAASPTTNRWPRGTPEPGADPAPASRPVATRATDGMARPARPRGTTAAAPSGERRATNVVAVPKSSPTPRPTPD